jgi:hypothetical protein
VPGRKLNYTARSNSVLGVTRLTIGARLKISGVKLFHHRPSTVLRFGKANEADNAEFLTALTLEADQRVN